MRIGIFDPYLDDIGGGEKYMMTIAECLSQQNSVSIFWDNRKDLELVKERFHLDLGKVTLVPNIFTNKTTTVTRFFETRKYDCIIILSDGSIPFVGAKKLVVHIQQPLPAFQNMSLLQKLKLKRVSKFFCNSEYTKKFIDKKFQLTTEIIYPPVALHPKKVKKENIVLHVGRFRVRNVQNGDYKKQSVMIEAFKHMVDSGLKNWEFVLAVSISEQDEEAFSHMKKLASGYPISFLINKTNNALWDIYSKAKIYWHASGYGEDLQAHPEFAEHFGISTVEAMGAGDVPIVINAGGQKEIVKEDENGFLWDSLEELQEKTRNVMDNPKLWKKLSQQAEETAKLFDDQAFCEKIQTLIS